MLFLALFLLASVPSVGATIELRSDATVLGTRITLGSVAGIRSADAALGERLAAFELGHAPAPNYSRYLTRAQIEQSLRQAFPELALELAGEPGCRVEPRVETVSPERIAEAARTALELGLRGSDARFELDRPLRELLVPQGESPAQLQARPPAADARGGSLAVPVEVRVDGAAWQTVWTHWRVEVFEVHPVLARAARRGERLGAADFELRRIDRAELGAPPLAVEALAGAILRRDLAPGAVVSEQDVERPLVVTRGTWVQLVIHNGPISARTLVNAQEDGRVGQRIRVVQIDSGNELLAIVRSSELVEIRLAR